MQLWIPAFVECQSYKHKRYRRQTFRRIIDAESPGLIVLPIMKDGKYGDFLRYGIGGEKVLMRHWRKLLPDNRLINIGCRTSVAFSQKQTCRINIPRVC